MYRTKIGRQRGSRAVFRSLGDTIVYSERVVSIFRFSRSKQHLTLSFLGAHMQREDVRIMTFRLTYRSTDSHCS